MDDFIPRQQDIALGTVVTLHRNWRDLPFSPLMTDADAEECLRRVWEALDAAGFNEKCRMRRMHEIPENERNDLVNRRVLPSDVAENDSHGAAYFLQDNHVTVGMGGGEQLSLRAHLPGFAPEETRDLATACDHVMADRALYAYDDLFGYLTSDPKLAGTGMTMEIVLHLQSLTRSGKLNAAEKEITAGGLSLTALSKEANIYCVSNPNTFGMSAEDIFDSVSVAALQLIEKEREVRQTMLKSGKIFLIDAAMRSASICASAHIMKKGEFMRLYGELRLGAALNILHMPIPFLDETLFLMQTESLSAAADQEIKGLSEDVFRADMLRKRLLAIPHRVENA